MTECPATSKLTTTLLHNHSSPKQPNFRGTSTAMESISNIPNATLPSAFQDTTIAVAGNVSHMIQYVIFSWLAVFFLAGFLKRAKSWARAINVSLSVLCVSIAGAHYH
ncbi:uncharacterized protein BDZ99DRAFT_567319 [Mytilinidion resinicola]|uniref:Uncharacterized protein n=1 Tax=Mytilinidion resinicola TaxID=574789 RepID=A0A6A6Z303_9PEZI|nr:uncharacterized protein BDZ99DRAFT_567319 [Mytilinidion resinicola]KAF2815486.1 hypothetical protein BDZ99DRAFT_567319 [Mytilinidion resinicola]